MTTALPSICFVSPTAYSIVSGDPRIKFLGGAELQQVIIGRELARRGHEVSIVCFDVGQKDAIIFNGITVYKCFRPDSGIPLIRAVVPKMTGMWQALQRADATIYYQRTAVRNTGIVAAFAKVHKKHSIHSVANDPDLAPGLPKLKYWIDKKIYAWGVRSVDRIVVQNSYQYSLCLKRFGREPSIIPNCLPSPAQGFARRDGYVLWVATFKREKRAEVFLELASRNPNLQFRIVGGPSRYGQAYYQEIQKRAKDLANLEFIGFVPYKEVDKHFDGARLLVNTSDYEGFPNTFLQAWSRQIPTVSFIQLDAKYRGKDVGQSVSGLEEMSRCVQQFMQDDKLWCQEGIRCQEYFYKNHAVGPVVDRYQALFEEMLVER